MSGNATFEVQVTYNGSPIQKEKARFINECFDFCWKKFELFEKCDECSTENYNDAAEAYEAAKRHFDGAVELTVEMLVRDQVGHAKVMRRYQSCKFGWLKNNEEIFDVAA